MRGLGWTMCVAGLKERGFGEFTVHASGRTHTPEPQLIALEQGLVLMIVDCLTMGLGENRIRVQAWQNGDHLNGIP